MKFTLQELLEQKALLERHLAWLEGKIREARGGAPETGVRADPAPPQGDTPAPPATPTPPPSPTDPPAPLKPPVPAAGDGAAGADDTIQVGTGEEVFVSNRSTLDRDLRSGCWFMAIGFLVLTVLCVAVVYLLWDHFREKPEKPRTGDGDGGAETTPAQPPGGGAPGSAPAQDGAPAPGGAPGAPGGDTTPPAQDDGAGPGDGGAGAYFFHREAPGEVPWAV